MTSKLLNRFKYYSKYNDKECIFTFIFCMSSYCHLQRWKVKSINYKNIPWKYINLRIYNFGSVRVVLEFHCWWVEVMISSSILLCILGELAEQSRVSVAVAVGISDMWQVTCYTWHRTCDTWHVTPDFFLSLFFLSLC